jgi:hypothetical protein
LADHNNSIAALLCQFLLTLPKRCTWSYFPFKKTLEEPLFLFTIRPKCIVERHFFGWFALMVEESCLSMQFDALVAALPLSSEEYQLKRIQGLQVYINLPY